LSCSPQTRNTPQRLAILPVNVLIDDPASDWLRAGAALVLEYDLATSPDWIASVTNNESGAYQMGAAAILRTTMEHRAGGVWMEAVITDNSTQRNRQVFTFEVKPTALIGGLDELAKRLDQHATSFSTRSIPALEDYARAAESSNPQSRTQLLKQAIGADPNFGVAYAVLLESAAREGNQTAAPILSQAATHQSSFTPIDRARVRVVAARLMHAPVGQKANAEAALLQLTPNNLEALVALGTDRFLTGNGQDGDRLLRRALELSPGNSTIRDRLAQGLIATKRYAEAEKLIANRPELAVCILLEGDTSRANQFANNFFSTISNSDLKTLFQATWLALSGELPTAIQTIQRAPLHDPAARSVALSEVALWQLRAGDVSAARAHAAQAFTLNQTAPGFPLLAQLITDDVQSPVKWRSKVEAAPLNTAAKQNLLGYGFFVRGNYSEAADVWRQMLSQSGDTDLRARAMLASSLDHEGNAEEAKKILIQPFLPEWGDFYAPVSFNEMRRLLK
jgi:tetratricopeptide (TPR) repeat protein